MENCTCPTCRFVKGEISKEAYAWYLKGSIEATHRILKTYNEKDTNMSPISWKSAAQYELDNDTVTLQQLIESNFENPDPALVHPEEYLAKIEK